jgi:putative NIF3 family GTP cyclohydrolase 1 type 2
VGDVVGALLERFPASWAEPWDRVGLLVGDGDWTARRILATLDLDRSALDLAAEVRADLLVTHHPPFLDDLVDLTRAGGGQGLAWDALVAGVAVASFHTNLDRSPEGADVLPHLLGFEVTDALEDGFQRMDLVTTYVPSEQAEQVRRAMIESGAGSIGRYRGCAFEVVGTGRFVPQDGADPSVGIAGAEAESAEVRVETVCTPDVSTRVVAAARGAHPYEEPLVVVSETRIARGAARMGRLCACDEIVDLESLARHVAQRLGSAPRVWGDPRMTVGAIACGNGSATSLVGTAQRLGADALVCGEVRYHAALEAVEAGMAIVEVGHDVSEWPLVPILADAVRSVTGGQGVEVVTADSEPRWWTWGVE